MGLCGGPEVRLHLVLCILSLSWRPPHTSSFLRPPTRPVLSSLSDDLPSMSQWKQKKLEHNSITSHKPYLSTYLRLCPCVSPYNESMVYALTHTNPSTCASDLIFLPVQGHYCNILHTALHQFFHLWPFQSAYIHAIISSILKLYISYFPAHSPPSSP